VSLNFRSISQYFQNTYSSVTNKRRGSNKRGGFQILEKLKVKLGCIDEKPYINVLN